MERGNLVVLMLIPGESDHIFDKLGHMVVRTGGDMRTAWLHVSGEWYGYIESLLTW
jgi:hypothetical protein